MIDLTQSSLVPLDPSVLAAAQESAPPAHDEPRRNLRTECIPEFANKFAMYLKLQLLFPEKKEGEVIVRSAITQNEIAEIIRRKTTAAEQGRSLTELAKEVYFEQNHPERGPRPPFSISEKAQFIAIQKLWPIGTLKIMFSSILTQMVDGIANNQGMIFEHLIGSLDTALATYRRNLGLAEDPTPVAGREEEPRDPYRHLVDFLLDPQHLDFATPLTTSTNPLKRIAGFVVQHTFNPLAKRALPSFARERLTEFLRAKLTGRAISQIFTGTSGATWALTQIRESLIPMIQHMLGAPEQPVPPSAPSEPPVGENPEPEEQAQNPPEARPLSARTISQFSHTVNNLVIVLSGNAITDQREEHSATAQPATFGDLDLITKKIASIAMDKAPSGLPAIQRSLNEQLSEERLGSLIDALGDRCLFAPERPQQEMDQLNQNFPALKATVQTELATTVQQGINFIENQVIAAGSGYVADTTSSVANQTSNFCGYLWNKAKQIATSAKECFDGMSTLGKVGTIVGGLAVTAVAAPFIAPTVIGTATTVASVAGGTFSACAGLPGALTAAGCLVADQCVNHIANTHVTDPIQRAPRTLTDERLWQLFIEEFLDPQEALPPL